MADDFNGVMQALIPARAVIRILVVPHDKCVKFAHLPLHWRKVSPADRRNGTQNLPRVWQDEGWVGTSVHNPVWWEGNLVPFGSKLTEVQ